MQYADLRCGDWIRLLRVSPDNEQRRQRGHARGEAARFEERESSDDVAHVLAGDDPPDVDNHLGE